MVPTPPSLALEVNCPRHVTSGLVRDWILIVPEPSRLPSASPKNNSPAIIAMTGPVEEKSPAPAGLAHPASPANPARPMTSILCIVDDLIQHYSATGKRRPPPAVVNRCFDYRHPCATRCALAHIGGCLLYTSDAADE